MATQRHPRHPKRPGAARAAALHQTQPMPAARKAMMATVLLVALTMLAGLWVQQAQARQVPREGFADLVERLAPAVVNISTTQPVERSRRFMQRREMPGTPFDELFRDFFERRGSPRSEPREVQSLGSGFVIDASGYIVTNNHVVGEASEIQVNFDSGLTLPATVVGTDEATDLAVIKVESPDPLPTVEFGDSDKARVGDWVVAIGNPFNLGRSVTAGIISARNRDIQAGAYDDFIQTDAAINRGNSGGPLFDNDGQVIGVNTVIISPTGGSVGIGFAISSALAQSVVQQLIEFGEARRGWLGVQIQPVEEDLAASFGLDDTKGALVAGVGDDSPAAQAGLKIGDIILSFDGQDVDNPRQLSRIVAGTEVGKKVRVELWRDGKPKRISVRTGQLDQETLDDMGSMGGSRGDGGAERELSDLGLIVAPVTRTRAQDFNIDPDTKGVLVIDVDQNGPAAGRVLPGDVITEVGQSPVETPGDLVSKIQSQKKKADDPVLLLLERRGQMIFKAVRPEGDN